MNDFQRLSAEDQEIVSVIADELGIPLPIVTTVIVQNKGQPDSSMTEMYRRICEKFQERKAGA